MKPARASGATPDLLCSSARLTWTSAGTLRRAAAESESSEWTSSQSRLTSRALRLCRWPMKCQRNAAPYAACCASRSCSRFSPTTSIPASTSAAMSSTDTYFVAATIVTPGPTSALIRSYRARIAAGSGVTRDQLPRGGELGLPPVELSVQLASPELAQHLADPWRLREAELGQVSSGHLEMDAPQVGEVPVQRGDVLELEG